MIFQLRNIHCVSEATPRIKGQLKLPDTDTERNLLSKSLDRAITAFSSDLGNLDTFNDFIDEALAALSELLRLGCSFDSFPKTLQKSMLSFMTSNLCLTSSQQIATFVHLLGEMGVEWNKLNYLAQGSVLSNCERAFGGMEPLEIVHCLAGLTSMGVKYKELTPGLQREVLAVLSNQSNMDMQCMVQIIGSLGYMGLRFDKCSREVKNSIVSRCGEALTTINHLQLNQMLMNLTFVGATWSTLGLQFRSTAYVCIERLVGVQRSVLDVVDKSRVANTLYHLGRLQAEWSELPTSTQMAVERQLCEGGSSLSSASLRHALSGLAAMGVDWNENLHETLQSFLLSSVAQNAASISQNHFYIASIMRHLGEMKALWSQLPTRLLEKAVVSSFSAQNSHDAIMAEHVASVVCSLYSMEAAWSELSPQTRQCLHDHILRLGHTDFISVCAIAHAISVLTFDCDYSCSLLSSVRSHLMDTLDEIASHGIDRRATLAQVFGFCDFLTAQGVGLSAYPRLRDLYRNSTLAPDLAPKDHELHAVLVRATSDALQRRFGQYEIKTEFSPFQSRLFPMDFAVFKRNKLSAFVELDGSKKHYTAQGNIRRQSRFKEYLYRCRFPDPVIPVLRMRTIEARALGVEVAGEKLADMITGKRRKTDESGGLTAKQKARADLWFSC